MQGHNFGEHRGTRILDDGSEPLVQSLYHVVTADLLKNHAAGIIVELACEADVGTCRLGHVCELSQRTCAIDP